MSGFHDDILMLPGPTQIPGRVLQALARPPVNHRSQAFYDLWPSLRDRARRVFQTTGDVFVLSGSGVGGLEAALVNVLSPGDRVLALVNGLFSQLFAELAEIFGARVRRLEFGWGEPVPPAAVADALEADADFRAVLLCHNETSTGVTSDAEAIGRLVAETPAVLLVDAVSSLGGIDLRADQWGLDVVVTASQKALMTPAGLALVSMGPKAWAAEREAATPRYFWSFRRMRDRMGRQPPGIAYTPAVNLWYGLHEALAMILDEGLEARFERHRALGRAVRRAAEALGCRVMAAESHASATVTALYPPSGIDPSEIVRRLDRGFGIQVGGGLGPLAGKIFRVGHMGVLGAREVLGLVSALEMVLHSLGARFEPGVATALAQRELVPVGAAMVDQSAPVMEEGGV